LGTESLDAMGPEFNNVTVSQNQFRSPARIINHYDYQPNDFHYGSNSYRSNSTAANQWFRVQTTNYDFAGFTAFMGETGASIAAPVNPVDVPSVGSYNASIGGAASEAAFLAAARQQSRQSWDVRYMAAPVITFLRTGLGLP
ncbi:MAG TPA: hypothetical protein VN181_06840, partial [Thermoanaerobaculia bacterium]|nr:hypothetical protein [Thermoanaerobaculia bacterium]